MHLVLLITLFVVYYFTGGSISDSNNRARKKQVFLMGFSIFLFAALRANIVGNDVGEYWNQYSIDADSSFSDLLITRAGRDPFFHVFLHFLSFISPNPQLMLAVIGAIVAIGFSYFSYYQKGNVLLFFVLFIGLRMYSFTLSGLRQAVAMGLVYIAYIYLKNRKNYHYLILTIIAGLFHSSAFVFLLAFPVVKYKKTQIFVLIVSLFVIVNILTNNALVSSLALITFEDRFEGYVERSQNMVFAGGFTFLIYVAIFIMSLFYYKIIKSKDDSFTESFKLLTIGVMFAFLGQSMDNVFRIAYYFIFISIPIFSQIIKSITSKQEESIIVFMTSVIFAAQYLILGTSAGVEEYVFFWEVPL